MARAEKQNDPGVMTFEEFVKRAPELTVLTDQPLTPDEAFDADTFNFRYKLGPLFDILRHPRTKTPMAILISGDWGTGKTSAMKWLQGLLEKWNETTGKRDVKIRPIWFYPWKYDNKEDVRRCLIAEVIISATYVRDPQTKKLKVNPTKLKQGVKTLGLFAAKAAVDLVSAVKIGVPGFAEVDGTALEKIVEDFKDAAHPEKVYLQEYERVLENWVTKSLSKNERMVIFIDDLDRCMPDIALQVLEVLKLYLNIPNLIFVLGVDKEVVEKLVVEHFRKLGLVRAEEKNKSKTEEKLQSEQENARSKKDEEKAKQYLSKMFQVEVTLDPSEQQVSDFLAEQLKELTYWDKEYLSTSEQELFRELVLDFADRNPREVKRLLNSALMTGAGAIMIMKDGIKFNQGMQLFFVRKILDKKYTMASEAGSSRGIEFFVEWSRIVRQGREKDEDFPLTIKVPSDFGIEPQKELDIEEKTQRRLDNLFATFAPEEYHDLLKNQKFLRLLHLLDDEDLGRLMQIPYPEEFAEVAVVVGTSKDDDIVREAVALKLNKKPDELNDDDYRSTKELNFSGSGITSISALKRFPDLQKLFLGGTQISDIGVLKDLTNLKWLSLRETQVSDIGVLSGLNMLQDLNLFGSQVSDITVLSGLTNLQELSLAGTKVSDISALAGLTKLQTLYLAGIKISDIGVLAGLINLQELSISRTLVNDIQPIREFNKLQTLYLHHTKVSDIGPLTGIKSLQSLDLGATQVSDFGVLAGLTKLQTLILSGTPVSDIVALAGLTSLQELNLSGTKVSDIGALAGLTNLHVLWLDNTKVSKIGVLAGLTDLRWLYLRGTLVSDEQVTELKKALPKPKIIR